jgi:hypothetical protein
MTDRDLQTAAARYVLGVLPSWELPRIADAALERDIYSLSLGELATWIRPVMADAGPLFEKALRELGMPLPSSDEAAWTLLRHHIGRVASGQMSPREGLRAVLRDVYYPAGLDGRTQQYAGDSHDIHGLISYYYGYDDLAERPTEVSFEGRHGADAVRALDAEIVRLAREWGARHGV